MYTVNVVYIKGAECVILWFPQAGCCVLSRVFLCTIHATPVGPSCYNIIFVWSDTAQHYVIVYKVSVSYVCVCMNLVPSLGDMMLFPSVHLYAVWCV